MHTKLKLIEGTICLWRMKRGLCWKSVGLGALVLLPFYASLISPASNERMHSPFPLTSITIALLLNLFLAGLLFSVAAIWLYKHKSYDWLLTAIPGAMLLLTLPPFLRWQTNPIFLPAWFWILLMTGVTAAMLWLRERFRHVEQGVLKFCGAILAGFGFFSVFVVIQLVRLAIWRPAPTETFTPMVQRASWNHHSRIIWILLDELSYDQVFGHRAQGLQLPNMDRLRQSSVLFTDAQPAGRYTEEVLPSILLGRQVQRVDYTYGNQFKVAFQGKGLEAFQASQTPFALARQYGFTTGVVGWYNPYCGILTPYLNFCYWTRTSLEDNIISHHDGIVSNIAWPWILYIRRLHDAFSTGARWNAPNLATRVPEYRQLMAHSISLVGDPQPDFILLHLPVPHPPGFYNRDTGKFDASGTRSYLDNLVLADKTLGEIMASLRSMPDWQETNVIVCGDHSWRTWRWQTHPDWSPEDQATSRGNFDPRPMLMVHLEGETKPETVSKPFGLLGVHEILDSLIQGREPYFQYEQVHAALRSPLNSRPDSFKTNLK